VSLHIKAHVLTLPTEDDACDAGIHRIYGNPHIFD
jgi:hypothetical protein